MAEVQTAGTTSESNGSQQGGETPSVQGGTPETFDGWLGKQDEVTKKLLEAHTAGLKSSLESERSDRKSVMAQLKALQAEGDPKELKAKVAQVEATLAEQTARNEFAEEAVSQGVGNLRLAYLAAKDADLLGKKDLWDKLKQQAPELFRKAATPAAAGNGSGAQPNGALTMNELLRGARTR